MIVVNWAHPHPSSARGPIMDSLGRNLERVAGDCSQADARYNNQFIGVRDFAGKGRGVIALRDIPPGMTLERCPVLVVPERDRAHTDPTVIFTYVYMWEHGTTEQNLYDGIGRAAIALGLSSLLNHSYTANATFIRHIDDLELELRSNQPISAGEEITIDYQMKLWFELT